MPRRKRPSTIPQRDRVAEAHKFFQEHNIVPTPAKLAINRPLRYQDEAKLLGGLRIALSDAKEDKPDAYLPKNTKLFNRLAFPVLLMGDARTQLSTGFYLNAKLLDVQTKFNQEAGTNGHVEAYVKGVEVHKSGHLNVLLESEELAAEREQVGKIVEELGLGRHHRAGSLGEVAVAVARLRSKVAHDEAVEVEACLAQDLDMLFDDKPIHLEPWRTGSLPIQ